MTYLYVVAIDAEKGWSLSFFKKRLWMVITNIYYYYLLLIFQADNLSFPKEFF
jgi:hypothetical protein